MFAGSVMSSTSTFAAVILARVLRGRSSYSSSGNAAIRHLLGRTPAQHEGLEHALRGVEILEVDPFVRPVGGLLDVARTEQHAWYPGHVHEKARVAGGAPGPD